jgi:hypothetical protein
MPSIQSKIMKKLNGFESHVVIVGLSKVLDEMRQDIIDAENNGRVPLMTVGYVEQTFAEIVKKIESLTLKQK